MDASWLALAAQLSGVAHFAPAPVPLPAVAARPVPSELSALRLSDIAARGDGYRRIEVSGRTLELGAGFAADETPTVLIKEAGAQVELALAQLRAGASAALPGGALPASYRDGLVRLGPASFKLDDLLGAVYERALKLELPAGVRYAVILQGPVERPDAVVMLRRDSSGIFWVGRHPAAQLGAIDWLCGINGTLYGMKLDRESLTFWSEPVPPLTKRLPKL